MKQDGFRYYPLIGGGLDGGYKRPLDHSYDSKEGAFKISAFCLESFVPGAYRLIAKNSTPIQKYHYFNIKCPNCGANLQEIAPARSKTELPLYGCTCCNRH